MKLFSITFHQVMLMLLAWGPRSENRRTRNSSWQDVPVRGIPVGRTGQRKRRCLLFSGPLAPANTTDVAIPGPQRGVSAVGMELTLYTYLGNSVNKAINNPPAGGSVRILHTCSARGEMLPTYISRCRLEASSSLNSVNTPQCTRHYFLPMGVNCRAL